ncbi:MAG: hypothetical protein CXZ00_12685 [Acidobacteria bacterium]|nr:MAG: hypothetical protein CXZ00_12685 [Acidobacteriota bacterium]
MSACQRSFVASRLQSNSSICEFFKELVYQLDFHFSIRKDSHHPKTIALTGKGETNAVRTPEHGTIPRKRATQNRAAPVNAFPSLLHHTGVQS